MKNETPVTNGGNLNKAYTPNIASVSPAVKSPHNDNLIFFHTALADLDPEEYKTAMSAICQYIADGTVPPLAGSLKVILTLAIDRITMQASAPRRRGGQRGNQNARKSDSSNNPETKKTNKNESKTNRSESSRATVVPVATPAPTAVASTATPSSPATLSPPNLNLNNNINFKYLNYLNCEKESESEKRIRIKNNLRRFGFTIADKTVAKIIDAVPDVMWLTQGYDFPTYLAQYVTDTYSKKGKTQLELQKLFISALNPAKWETPWKAYPSWLSAQMDRILIDKEALIRKTPPQKTCPDCGETARLEGLRCPKCGGFYEWDEQSKSHNFIHHLNLNFSGSFDRLLAIRRRREQEASNANTIQ